MNILWFLVGYICGLFSPALFMLLLSAHIDITWKENEELPIDENK